MSDEFTLNEHDFWFINIILVGTTKLISNIIRKNPKNKAKSLSYNFKKHLAHDDAINIVKKIGDGQIFRRKDIWQKLSKDEQEVPDADFSRVLRSMENIQLIHKAERKSTDKKWGRPLKSNPYVSDTPGPKTFYELNDFYKNIRKVLSDPHKVKIIYSILYHSGMIHRLVKHIQIISIHVIKLNDKHKAWTILKSNYLSDKEKENFYKDYASIHSIEDSKELTELANKKAAQYVKKRKAIDYVSIFEDGGLAYPSSK